MSLHLIAAPTFALVILLTLVVATGANSAIFSVINGALLLLAFNASLKTAVSDFHS